MWESLGECNSYITGTLQGATPIIVYLPAKCPYCAWCKYFREHTLDRYSCRLNEEWLFNPKKERGENCPVLWEGLDSG